MSSNTILVFSEKPALLRELLGEARQQADVLGWTVAAVGLGKTPRHPDETGRGCAVPGRCAMFATRKRLPPHWLLRLRRPSRRVF